MANYLNIELCVIIEQKGAVSMYELRVRQHFSAAHKLNGYSGKCANLHGHNWMVEMIVSGNTLNNIGMLADFSESKNWLKSSLKKLDHYNLNNIFPFSTGESSQNPTAENIARYIFNDLKEKLDNKTVKLKKITVWESDWTAASYMED